MKPTTQALFDIEERCFVDTEHETIERLYRKTSEDIWDLYWQHIPIFRSEWMKEVFNEI